MHPVTSGAFALPEALAAKRDRRLIGDDERHFARIAQSMQHTLDELQGRLDTARRAPGREGQAALERDVEIHRLTGRVRTLRRFGLDLCLGRVIPLDGSAAVYVGRLGLTDADGDRLLVDWRSPAAEPFFAATHAKPLGLASRRRYRWVRGRITDYWDEVFSADGLEGHAALDDQSAFIAALGASRSARMQDVLGTIQTDQDAIIRAGSQGALVVDGGPGTGKTVVALHRTAYLLYADPRLGHRRGGVLFVGPHQPYLDYVSDVLPSLGEDGVRTCTLRDLVPEGAAAAYEASPEAARLKSSARMVQAIEAAVAIYEQPPTAPLAVQSPWGEVDVDPADWAHAVDAVPPGTPHNEARERVLAELVELVVDENDDDVPVERMRAAVRTDPELNGALNRAWPLLRAADLVGDLWSVPAYLHTCAPWLSRDEVFALQRADPTAWTVEDLPLLDAARLRLGDPDAARRARQRADALARHAEQMSYVVEDLIAADDSELRIMSMLRGQDAKNSLADDSAAPAPTPDALAGPFAHVVVDEAQELTDAQWQMLLARCPTRSFTIVGDRAQARHGFTESWVERLERVGFGQVSRASLRINYRTPSEVMDEAAPVIRAVLPDANVPASIRSSGLPVVHAPLAALPSVLDEWSAAHAEGTACVITTAPERPADLSPRVRWLTPQLSKGLEFDLVLLVEPDSFGAGIEGAVDRYVAMTRATRQLVIVTPAGVAAASGVAIPAAALGLRAVENPGHTG